MLYSETTERRGKLPRETTMAEGREDWCRETNRRTILREKKMVEGRENWFRATNRGRGRSSEESVAVYLLGALLILTVPDSRGIFFLSRLNAVSI